MRLNYVAALGICIAALAYGVVQRSRTIYPSEKTQSLFFRTFSVDRKLTPFIDSSVGQGMGTGVTSNSGTGLVTYQRNIQPRFRLKGDVASMAASVREHVAAEITRTGATILDERVELLGNTVIQYVAGQSRGVVRLSQPFAVDELTAIDILIDERWQPAR